jgi:prepilin-type N-terminal cleavage/methylation domain-containing protein
VKQMKEKGFSLLEMMVVLSVFALLAMIASQALILTLRGGKKSTNVTKVRESVDFALAVIERQLHNASEVTPCPNSDTDYLEYLDERGEIAFFSCEEGFVASSSARITSEGVEVTKCSIECFQPESGLPYVEVNLSARESDSQGVESARVTSSTRVNLRIY